MADNVYTPYATTSSSQETALRGGLANVANMSGGLQDIAARTGGPQINPNEIPTIGGLANMKATTGKASTARESAMKREVKGLPAFASGYRQYLIWRYPNRYGNGSTTSYSNNYTSGGITIPALTLGQVPK